MTDETYVGRLQEQAVAVVVIGRFEPADFAANGLRHLGKVLERSPDDVRIETVHPELAVLSVGGLSFDVTRERLMIVARAEPFVRLIDVVAAMAATMTNEDLTGMVFVYASRFGVDDLRQLKEFGRQLAPLDAWGRTADLFEGAHVPPGISLASLTQQWTLLDDNPGTLKATVQPSDLDGVGPGAWMQIERSFVWTEQDRDPSDFARRCIDQYHPTLRTCRRIVEEMVERAGAL